MLPGAIFTFTRNAFGEYFNNTWTRIYNAHLTDQFKWSKFENDCILPELKRWAIMRVIKHANQDDPHYSVQHTSQYACIENIQIQSIPNARRKLTISSDLSRITFQNYPSVSLIFFNEGKIMIIFIELSFHFLSFYYFYFFHVFICFHSSFHRSIDQMKFSRLNGRRFGTEISKSYFLL